MTRLHRWLSFVALLPILTNVAFAQNSTRKVRDKPSATAERAGTAIGWRTDVQEAIGIAKEQGKLVLWYVPTVKGSPMDRKPEIDRYLMAGPFSWPAIVDVLQQRFVPVKATANGELQRKYGLVRQKFIEPGWLLLDGDGNEKGRLDQLTTLDPQWFLAPLLQAAGQPDPGFPCAPALREAWSAYRDGNRGQAIERVQQVLMQQPADPVRAEAMWLHGAALCRDNQRVKAVAVWNQLAEALPEQPFAWKAAMEAEGHGPFVHGFEDYLPLPERVLKERDEGSRAPRGTFTDAQLWQRSVAFLLAMDDGDGMLRDSTYDFGGTDSLPNVWAAVSCLAGKALLAAAARQQRGALELDAGTQQRLEAMLQRLLGGDVSVLALQDRDEILWAHAYRARFLSAWITLRPADRDQMVARLQAAVDAMQLLQPENGVWFHEYGNPFAIATALQALHEARQLGATVDQQKIDRGLRALAQCRLENGAFSYGHPGRGKPQSSLAAAAGRMPLCELARLLWGDSDQEQLGRAVETGFRHHGLLAAVRKYDDHADQHAYGGFFFWFDMLGRAEATMALSDVATRDLRAAQQKKLVLDLPEFDGCFVDSHELGRTYGTAMALLCLDALDRAATGR